MDRDQETEHDLELDQLMERASASMQKSLDATIDVKQRLRDLLSEAGYGAEDENHGLMTAASKPIGDGR